MTLIEMLVVLAIIGIVASISVLSLGSTGRMDGRVEARELEARLQVAADQNMIGDVPRALALSPDGYGFKAWNDERGVWEDPPTGTYYALPKGMTLRAQSDERVFPLGADAGGKAFTLALATPDQTWAVEFDGVTARVERAQNSLAGEARP